jgi:general L-amino acid transport system permease protein
VTRSRLLSALLALGLAFVLWQVVDWAVWHAVFRADLSACRALAHEGACWGVIAEKYRPMLLGGYPHEAQWRPLLALAITLVTALVLAASAWRIRGWKLRGRAAWGITVLGLGSSLVLMRGGVAGLESVPLSQWGGLPLTLVLTLLSLGLSLPLGIALALGRRSRATWLSLPCTGVIELVRGLPLVTLLFMAAFMLPALFPVDAQPSLFVRVSATLALFSAAYLAELVRAGLQTVPKEQVEAAQVLGLTGWRIQQKVVLPQALRAVLPALVSHTIGLLKDTSLVMVVSLHELTGSLALALGGDADWRPFYFEGYLFIAAIYALMCLGLARLGRRIEARWQSAVRP